MDKKSQEQKNENTKNETKNGGMLSYIPFAPDTFDLNDPMAAKKDLEPNLPNQQKHPGQNNPQKGNNKGNETQSGGLLDNIPFVPDTFDLNDPLAHKKDLGPKTPDRNEK